MFVYLITNNVNGKRYVGQHSGNNLQRYWKSCANYALRGDERKPLLYRSIRKYGLESFSVEPLVEVSSKWEMDLYERGMIKAYNLTNPEKGYNLTGGGGGTLGFTPSRETRIKCSLAKKGTKLSEETRRKISEGNKGKIMSAESRRKISIAHKGKTLSEEHRQKISRLQQGRICSEETRRKLSVVRTGNKNALGSKHSEEMVRRFSESRMGHAVSLETREKIGRANSGRRPSEEARKRMSESQKRRFIREQEQCNLLAPRV